MKSFTVRVELHHATTWQDYDALHREMAREGFSRTIVGRDGVTYELPTAEYVMSADYTINQVLEKAKSAAGRTGKTYSVLVSETASWMWTGLPPAKKVA